VPIYENRRMKSLEIILRRGRDGSKKMMEGINLGYIVITYVNITIYPPIQILYGNKIIEKKISSAGANHHDSTPPLSVFIALLF
jgi:hypothetical protein